MPADPALPPNWLPGLVLPEPLGESENEYRFSGLMMRVIGLVMPGSFRKQSLQHMRDFKTFAEQGTYVRPANG